MCYMHLVCAWLALHEKQRGLHFSGQSFSWWKYSSETLAPAFFAYLTLCQKNIDYRAEVDQASSPNFLFPLLKNA